MKRIYFLFMLLIIGTSVSCAEKSSLSLLTEATVFSKDTLPTGKSNHIELDSIHTQFWHWYYGKYSVSYSDNSRKIGFKLSLKCTQDSVANALITFAAIPFVNSLITKDSLTYVNKKDRCFEIYPVDRTKKLLGIALTLDNLEELFLGLPIGFHTNMQFEKKIKYDSIYFSYRDDKISANYAYHSASKHIVNQTLELADGRKMFIEYNDWNEGLVHVPSSFTITITSKEEVMHLNINTERFEINVPQEIELIIPEDYEKCN